MKEASIRVILKSGVDFTISCDDFKVTVDTQDNTIVDLQFGNPKCKRPLYINFDEVASIIQNLLY